MIVYLNLTEKNLSLTDFHTLLCEVTYFVTEPGPTFQMLLYLYDCERHLSRSHM